MGRIYSIILLNVFIFIFKNNSVLGKSFANVKVKTTVDGEELKEVNVIRNNFDFGKINSNLKIFDIDDCNRKCIKNDVRICHAKWVLEFYQTMGPACKNCGLGNDTISDCYLPQCVPADGIERGILSINRQLPGPALHVCEDDILLVDIENHMMGNEASIHWHGLHMVETPFMDGVPFLTQCPIPAFTSFRYYYRASQPGTHLYHSHSGLQRSEGQFGALVIHQAAENDIHSKYYDYDLPQHTIVISDWLHDTMSLFADSTTSNKFVPKSILINGRAQYQNEFVPLENFDVEPGKRYRFRFVNAASLTCLMTIQFENHRMQVISSDSFNVIPVMVDTITTGSGERYDVIINTDQTPKEYHILVKATGSCESLNKQTVATLRYKGAPTNEVISNEINHKEFPNGVELNNPSIPCSDKDKHYCITELESVEEDLELRDAEPYGRYYLGFSLRQLESEEIFQTGTYHRFEVTTQKLIMTALVNGKSLTFPSFPPLTQPELINESSFCYYNESFEDVGSHWCTHVLKLPTNKIIELVIVDEVAKTGSVHHPFHLHGYRYMVKEIGISPDLRKPLTARFLSKNDNGTSSTSKPDLKPPFKDTVVIPSKGYVRVRLRTENPGFWLLHCHYEMHLSLGMALILQVGDPTEMIKSPHDFPKCGNFKPTNAEIMNAFESNDV